MELDLNKCQSHGIPARRRMDKSIFTYVVRYDSGFAPNPFFGFCTIATCKAKIRKSAQIGDWIVGTGSASKEIRRGGHLVFAMQVSETPCTADYWNDPRFEQKRPNLFSGWMRASGDNIYLPRADGSWSQCNSYHSKPDGTPNPDHVQRDTSVERILVSDRFVYFGAEGDKLPDKFQVDGEFPIVMEGRSYRRKTDTGTIQEFEEWFDALREKGLQGEPWDWIHNPSNRGYF